MILPFPPPVGFYGGCSKGNIGARIRRVEDRRLLTGLGTFTADHAVAGALHVAFRRSDQAHALISSIGTAAAAEMPGVFAVYNAQDLRDLVEPVQAVSRLRDYHPTPFYPLARERSAMSANRLPPSWPRTGTSRRMRATGSRSFTSRSNP